MAITIGSAKSKPAAKATPKATAKRTMKKATAATATPAKKSTRKVAVKTKATKAASTTPKQRKPRGPNKKPFIGYDPEQITEAKFNSFIKKLETAGTRSKKAKEEHTAAVGALMDLAIEAREAGVKPSFIASAAGISSQWLYTGSRINGRTGIKTRPHVRRG